MDAEVKTKWVEALRGGKFEQGRATLRDGDRFCCLGVLCEVAALGKWVEGDYEGQHAYAYGDVSTMDVLPMALADQIGLGMTEQSKLWAMNDMENKSFAEIADYIEENL